MADRSIADTQVGSDRRAGSGAEPGAERVTARGAEPDSEKHVSELDDVADRDELRSRFEMLLQELRVTLPGVQVLAAFMLIAPFSQRFGELDVWGRRAFGTALLASMTSAVCLLAPTLLHRVGERRARSRRLEASIVLMMVGLIALAVALVSALWGVARFVFGTTAAWAFTIPVVALLVALWIVVPLSLRPRRRVG